jgi:hypothetical protein
MGRYSGPPVARRLGPSPPGSGGAAAFSAALALALARAVLVSREITAYPTSFQTRRHAPPIAQTSSQAATPNRRSLVHRGPTPTSATALNPRWLVAPVPPPLSSAPAKATTASAALTKATTTNGMKKRRVPATSITSPKKSSRNAMTRVIAVSTTANKPTAAPAAASRTVVSSSSTLGVVAAQSPARAPSTHARPLYKWSLANSTLSSLSMDPDSSRILGVAFSRVAAELSAS